MSLESDSPARKRRFKKRFDSFLFFRDKDFTRLYFRLLRRIRPYLWLWIAVVSAIIVVEASNAGRKLIYKPLIDQFEPGQSLSWERIGEGFSEALALYGEPAPDSETLPHKTKHRFPVEFWLVVFGALTLGRNLLQYFQSVYSKWVGLNVIRQVRLRVYNHILALPMRYFDKNRSGDLLARITADINLLKQSVDILFEEVLTKPMEILFALSAMFYLSWKLTLFVLILAPIIAVTIIPVARAVKRLSRIQRAQNAEITSFLVESLSGMRLIKAFNRYAYKFRQFDYETMKFFDIMVRRIRVKSLTNPINDTILYGTIIAGVLVFSFHDFDLTKGAIIAFFVLLLGVRGPLKDLTNMQYKMLEALAGAERVFQVLDEAREPEEAENPVELSPPRLIEFRNVSFAYGPSGENALTDVSFQVQAGERIAIVGPSGAGKTTLINLLCRLYDPTAGSITFDGVDIRRASLVSLRNLLGLVPQEPFLFHETIEENVVFGRPYDRAALERALTIGHCWEFVNALPEKEKSLVGERGCALSGGQRQRLTLARALYNNPPILLLDEATSSLDTESELLVQAALADSMAGRTTFVVAHRLSTILDADRILVLDHGCVVETGSHAELLARGGFYAEMFQLQFAGKNG
ncbi:ABC transporter ATP-binding protein [bacterium]|nr:ABC transporter ATP-binding protein [bacterium]